MRSVVYLGIFSGPAPGRFALQLDEVSLH
jgi:hypothetical protein